MTKLWILSDLHHDVAAYRQGDYPDADIVVLAGDVQNDRFVRELMDRYLVVYVAGNHEFYGREHSVRLNHLKNQFGASFFDNDTRVIQGIRFIGATLWTDYCVEGIANKDEALGVIRKALNDHRKIYYSDRMFEPSDAEALHHQSRAYIEAMLKQPLSGPTVVVTHHGVSPRSIHPKYKGDLINAGFSSDLTDMIEQYRPQLWVHGHTHSPFDYKIEDTRIICNPRGYGAENPSFIPNLVVEV